MKKDVLYVIGIIIMALGVAISSFHGLGAAPFDSFNFNVANITNLQIGTTMFIYNSFFVLLFFIMLQLSYLSPVGILLSWFLCPFEMTLLFFYNFLPFWHKNYSKLILYISYPRAIRSNFSKKPLFLL